MNVADVAWVGVDWGTSHLRAHVVGRDGRVLARPTSNAGMATLARDGFEPALATLLAPWLGERKGPLQIVACGMVGARQGWIEAPYAAVPCPPLDPARMVRAPAHDARLVVRVIPGLSQASPPDVMRGEETQIAGFLAAEPGFDGVACLPGTHSKWVRISAGEVVGFQTFLTGELFDLLAHRSVLRHTLAADGWDDAAFAQALDDALAHPARFGAALFGLRAGALIAGLAPEAARARLSGLVIGMELAGARPCWLGQRVALIGAPKLSGVYAAALAAQGVAASRHDGGALVLAGLGAARNTLTEAR